MKEEEIRPEKIFNEYLRLAKKDAVDFFENSEKHEVKCFACGGELENKFNKYGFDYCSCQVCQSILVSPRPELDSFINYYTDSPSTEFWAKEFYKHTENARKEKLWKPKSRQIRDLISFDGGFNIVDIGSGYGSFLDTFDDDKLNKVVAIEPSVHLSEILISKGYKVVPKVIEEVLIKDLPQGRNVFTCFELFEHLHDPTIFKDVVSNLMKSGDVFIFTTLSGEGFDIKLLGAKSKSIHPPHHLNFFNPISMKLLFQDLNANVEVFTPGKLDVDIVIKSIHDTSLSSDTKLFLKNLSENEILALQEIIRTTNNSSHMWTVIEKC